MTRPKLERILKALYERIPRLSPPSANSISVRIPSRQESYVHVPVILQVEYWKTVVSESHFHPEVLGQWLNPASQGRHKRHKPL